MSKKRASAPAINDEFRRDATEQLLLGADPDALAQRLASRGIAFALVKAEIDRALASPYFRAAGRLRARLDKREWVLENFARLGADDPAARAIPRRDRLDAKSFFADHYALNRPVLIGGLFDDWPARTLWSLDYLEKRVGGREVDVQWGRENDEDFEANKAAHTRTMPMAAVIERLRDPQPTNDFYITANNSGRNRRALGVLWDDVRPIPGYHAEEPGNDGFLWIGPKGTITPFHHDLTNNLLIQIVGAKRVRMVAAHDTPLMRNSRHCFSDWKTDELIPGPPAPGRPEVLVCDLAPGEALFIPVGWWHHVEGLDQTIGMSFTNFARPNDHYNHYKSYEAV